MTPKPPPFTIETYIRNRDKVIYSTTTDEQTKKAIKLKYNIK